MKRAAFLLLLFPVILSAQEAKVTRTKVLTVSQGATLRGDSIISKAQVASAISAALAGYVPSIDSGAWSTHHFVASAIAESLTVRSNDYADASHTHAGVYQPAGTYTTPSSVHDSLLARSDDYAGAAHTHTGFLTGSDSTAIRDESNRLYLGKPLGSGAENYVPKWSASAGGPVWRPDSGGSGASGISAETAAGMIRDSATARADDYSAIGHNHTGVYQPAGTYATPASLSDTAQARANDYATAEHNHTGTYQPVGTYSTPTTTHDSLAARANDYATVEHNHTGTYQPAGTYATPASVHDSVDARADDYQAKPSGTGQENYVPKWSAAAGGPVWRPDSTGAGGSGIDAATAAGMINDSLDNMPLVHLGIYNVKDYGAVGNGSTSDSASIQNAINAAYTAGGGVVYIPSGTYIANVKIKSNVKLRGAGFNLTTLKSRAGSNRSVVQSDSFYTWTGSTTFGGNVDFEISHMTIDANKAANADSGYGVRVYGKRFKIFDVTIQNAKQDGLYTEWGGTASYNNPSEDQEAFVGRIKTIFNDGNGWRFNGPGDIEAAGMLSYQNKAWGIKVMSPMHLSQYNGYLNDTGAVHICYSGVIFGSDIHATTATGWGMLIDAGVGCSSISDISATGPIGVEIRSVGQVITGIVQNTTNTGVKIDGGSANLIITMTGNSGYWFDLANVGGTNNVIVSAQNGATGTLLKPAQYPGPWDTWFVGGAPAGYTGWRFKPPQDKIYVNGYEPVLPATNDTLVGTGYLTSTLGGYLAKSDTGTSAIITQSELIALKKSPEDFVRPNSDTWYGPNNGAMTTAPTTQACVASTVRAFPFYVGTTYTIDSVKFEVSTGVSGNIALAIYEDSDGDLYPDNRVLDLGSYTVTSTAVKADTLTAPLGASTSNGTFTFTANKLYFIGVHSNTTATLRAVAQTSMPHLLGWNPALGTNSQYTAWNRTSVTYTYPNSAPNPYGASAAKLANTACPLLVWRVKP